MENVDFRKILNKDITLLDAEAFRNKGELFETMAVLFENAGYISDRDAYLESLYFRESQGPTYMGDEIAMPHGKCDAVLKPGVCIVRTKEPFMYESHGEAGQTRLVFMLAIPGNDDSNLHIRMLAALARKLVYPEIVKTLMNADCFEEVLKAFEKE